MDELLKLRLKPGTTACGDSLLQERSGGDAFVSNILPVLI
jgi:hypothetical protein